MLPREPNCCLVFAAFRKQMYTLSCAVCSGTCLGQRKTLKGHPSCPVRIYSLLNPGQELGRGCHVPPPPPRSSSANEEPRDREAASLPQVPRPVGAPGSTQHPVRWPPSLRGHLLQAPHVFPNGLLQRKFSDVCNS